MLERGEDGLSDSQTPIVGKLIGLGFLPLLSWKSSRSVLWVAASACPQTSLSSLSLDSLRSAVAPTMSTSLMEGRIWSVGVKAAVKEREGVPLLSLEESF